MPGKYSIKKCPRCGNQESRRSLYCSQTCVASDKRDIKIKEWLSGNHSGMRGKTQTAVWIKQYLRDSRGDKCEKCGWDKKHNVTGNVPIELSHKDGNYLNNKIENLELICPNCHSLTDSYRSLNIGKGRPYDRSNKK
jgi:predicted RNA-binding Zn-ribbon protein involved in translation (DUF1610 family)